MTITVHRSSCKVPIILVDLNKNLISRQIFEKQSNMKIRPVEAKLFHAQKTDGQTRQSEKSLFAIFRMCLKT